jgi:hypothetical protein
MHPAPALPLGRSGARLTPLDRGITAPVPPRAARPNPPPARDPRHRDRGVGGMHLNAASGVAPARSIERVVDVGRTTRAARS